MYIQKTTGSWLARSKVKGVACGGKKWVWSHVTQPGVLEALAGRGSAGRVVVEHGSEEGGERASLLCGPVVLLHQHVGQRPVPAE